MQIIVMNLMQNTNIWVLSFSFSNIREKKDHFKLHFCLVLLDVESELHLKNMALKTENL